MDLNALTEGLKAYIPPRSGKGKVHFSLSGEHFSCDGNRRLQKPRWTNNKLAVTCGRCLKMIAAGDSRRVAEAEEAKKIDEEFAARCLVAR
jgi:hypothetical protein